MFSWWGFSRCELVFVKDVNWTLIEKDVSIIIGFQSSMFLIFKSVINAISVFQLLYQNVSLKVRLAAIVTPSKMKESTNLIAIRVHNDHVYEIFCLCAVLSHHVQFVPDPISKDLSSLRVVR